MSEHILFSVRKDQSVFVVTQLVIVTDKSRNCKWGFCSNLKPQQWQLCVCWSVWKPASFATSVLPVRWWNRGWIKWQQEIQSQVVVAVLWKGFTFPRCSLWALKGGEKPISIHLSNSSSLRRIFLTILGNSISYHRENTNFFPITKKIQISLFWMLHLFSPAAGRRVEQSSPSCGCLSLWVS